MLEARADGFSLIEVLVASSILVAAVVSLAELGAISTRANTSAGRTSTAWLIAEAKMEQLRSLQWGFDADGGRLTDTSTDTATMPESATGGVGLSPSPSGALASNTTGYVDYLNAYGDVLGGSSSTPPTGTVYIRRWSIEPLPDSPDDTVVLQVLVRRSRKDGGIASAPSRQFDEARLIGVRTRKAR